MEVGIYAGFTCTNNIFVSPNIRNHVHSFLTLRPKEIYVHMAPFMKLLVRLV